VLPLHLDRADRGERARPSLRPSEERLRELTEKVAAGRYRVPPEAVAEAVLRAWGAPDPLARRD
jgi:hypothetical protein